MSGPEAEIRELCEKLLNRTFDSEDNVLLRNFLRDLQREKVPKDKKPQKINPVLLSPRGGSGSGEKPSYVKGEDSSVDTQAIREERLAEAKSQAGVKDRLGNWQKKIEQGDTPTSNPSLVEERVSEAKNVGVKDRLGSWQKKLDEGDSVHTDSSLVEERLAEAKNVGVKDRLGSWQKKLEEGDSQVTDSHKKDEVLSEIQGAGKLKDRLQNYTSAATTEKEKPKHEEEELLTKSHSVQKGRETWLKSQESTLTTDPNTVAERTAEVKSSGSSLKDRMSSYQQTATKEEVYVRKDPIKIDFFEEKK
jgi:hypothetical protein